MEGYKVSIIESSRELTAREKIRIKDTSNAISLDTATQGNAVVITPVAYAVLAIHNEKSDDKDYENYIIIDNNGDKYVTGSRSFWSSFKDIWEDMRGEDEAFQVEIYRLESKNYKGKSFITCSIV